MSPNYLPLLAAVPIVLVTLAIGESDAIGGRSRLLKLFSRKGSSTGAAVVSRVARQLLRPSAEIRRDATFEYRENNGLKYLASLRIEVSTPSETDGIFVPVSETVTTFKPGAPADSPQIKSQRERIVGNGHVTTTRWWGPVGIVTTRLGKWPLGVKVIEDKPGSAHRQTLPIFTSQ